MPVGREIVWLGEPACHEQGLVGGKVANLSRLAAEHHVPPGFCLTTVAYDRARASGFALDEAAATLGRLPSALSGAMASAYRTLAERLGEGEVSVAVRSSAVDEDGAAASFAGQHESYLNVVGLEAVAEAVQRCWASGRSARALDYRRHHGLGPEGGGMAVLVQQLVVADASAVVFSANPVTGSGDEVVINASWGLGESIVGGTVTPDSYVVQKTDLAITARQIGEKGRMTVLVAGGTREVEVPRLFRSRPTLEDAQVTSLARLALALEATMGWPVDVECAYQGSQLYLLQCRPITTLAGGC